MPLEMRILKCCGSAVPSVSTSAAAHPNVDLEWSYALALHASLQQSSAAAAAGDLRQADGHFNTALKTAAQMAGLRQTRPQSSQPPHLSNLI
ncbi:TPA: hypothetical protein ACH3X1_007302 [Trebouxia sp. C0004]